MPRPPPVPPVSQLKPVVLGYDNEEEGEEEDENERENALVIDTGMASVKVCINLHKKILHYFTKES